MISLQTNSTALMVQKHLNNAIKGINNCILQLTTGYKLNSAKDNPANYAIMKNMESKLSSLSVAQDNMNIGMRMLDTASSSAELIISHTTRIRDLCQQACNGTYGEESITAIKSEVQARLDEIDRIYGSTEFNGIKLFQATDGDKHNINLQVGIDSSEASRITVDTALNFERVTDVEDLDITNPEVLERLDSMLSSLSNYQVRVGASQNRLEYALEANEIQSENLTSSLSTIRDADIAKVSSDLIRYQILQQACATLLSTANQMPSIALQLLSGLGKR